MPLPQASDMHIDTYLTNVSVGYAQADSAFAADRVFPRVGSPKQSNKYATYTIADSHRDEMKVRSPGAESAGGGYRVSSDSFFCDVFASHIDVDDQTVAASDNPYAPMEDATRVLVHREKLKRDVQFASTFFTTGVWTGGTSADPTAASLSAAWDDPSSTPIEDIHDQINAVKNNTGFMPNRLVLNTLGWFALKNHPDIVDRVKHTSGAPLTEDVVARAVGVDRIVHASAIRNTAQEGLAASMSSIFGNNALLVYAADSPGLYTPSGGYQFVWSGYPGSADGTRMRRFYLDANAAWRVEIESAFDMKVVDGTCGVFIQSVAS